MSDQNPPADHVVVDDNGEKTPLEQNVRSSETWMRLVFNLAYLLIIVVVGMVGLVVVVLSFLWVLFNGEVNTQLQQAGQGIASYVYQIGRYLTFNTNRKPFPFGDDWPGTND